MTYEINLEKEKEEVLKEIHSCDTDIETSAMLHSYLEIINKFLSLKMTGEK